MLSPDLPRAACADRLDLVDAAFIRPGRAQRGEPPRPADELALLCERCPIAHDCLTEAMLRHEFGMWAGTSPNARTRHGAPGKCA